MEGEEGERGRVEGWRSLRLGGVGGLEEGGVLGGVRRGVWEERGGRWVMRTKEQWKG